MVCKLKLFSRDLFVSLSGSAVFVKMRIYCSTRQAVTVDGLLVDADGG